MDQEAHPGQAHQMVTATEIAAIAMAMKGGTNIMEEAVAVGEDQVAIDQVPHLSLNRGVEAVTAGR